MSSHSNFTHWRSQPAWWESADNQVRKRETLKLLIFWDFHKQQCLEFIQNGGENNTQKTSVVVSGSSVDGDERGQRRTASHTLSWREGYSNFNNHCVQLCWAEKRLRRINMPHLGADGLQQQKTMSYFTPVSEEQESGAMVGWRKTLEKGHLVF